MDPRARPRPFASALLAGAASLPLLVWVRSAAPGVHGIDLWYHLAASRQLAAEGIRRTFPWMQETVLRDRWADKDLIPHLLMVPFQGLEPARATLAFGVLAAAVGVAAFHLVLRTLAVPRPGVWTLLLLGSSATFLDRLVTGRPWVVGLILLLLGIAAVTAQRAGAAALCAALAVPTHVSFPLLPAFAAAHALAGGSRRVTVWTAGGTALGLLANPYFPNHLRLWWVQIVDVLSSAWTGGEDLRLATELDALSPGRFAWDAAGLLAALGLGVVFLARAPRRSPASRSLAAAAAAALVLALLSRRFLEIAAPAGILFAAAAARDAGVHLPRRRLVAFALLAAGAAAGQAVRVHGWLKDPLSPSRAEAAAWIAAHVPDGETVVHLDWDDFPELWYAAPQARYLVGLDPTFFAVADRARWRAWDALAGGGDEDPYGTVRNTFRSRWVFATRDHEDFLRQARRDPRFVPVHADGTAIVYRLEDAGEVVTVWTVDGGRRSFPGGFVDLGEERCAAASTEIRNTEALGITSDDAVRVTVDGTVVLDAPLPDPGAPIDLLTWLARAGSLDEQVIPLGPAPGPRTVAVRACRGGDDLGFLLRLLPAPPAQGQAAGVRAAPELSAP